jgi:hypothetical protein
MAAIVQARLDRETETALRNLAGRLGWSSSKIVREGIHLLDACHPAAQRPRIVGLGKFASGIRDLGSNKRHLAGFGR